MIGTATSKLFPRSSAACPPRLKIPTLYPVLPRLRVGIAACVLEFTGSAGIVAAATGAAMALCVSKPAATAPPVFRKLRRSGELGVCFIGISPHRKLRFERRAHYSYPPKKSLISRKPKTARRPLDRSGEAQLALAVACPLP